MNHIEFESLNSEQQTAYDVLEGSQDNVFVTGAAGSGKSFLIKKYLFENPHIPVLASTGSAAVLVGGRTFHSFFGLGIMAGGIEKTVAQARRRANVIHRIRENRAIVIDEISMISAEAFVAADLICREILKVGEPFGGMRLIVVGDFLQLPPVSRNEDLPVKLFKTELWQALDFKSIYLTKIERTKDFKFIEILHKIRLGRVDPLVTSFLNDRVSSLPQKFYGTILFGRRKQVEDHNLAKLTSLEGDVVSFETTVIKREKTLKSDEKLISLSPLPEVLKVKKDALVMFRKNDPNGIFVNGTLGKISKIKKDSLVITLKNKTKVTLKQDSFSILNADGDVEAEVVNFPINLAWATTIHKSQGTSIESVFLDLSSLWDSGQAYVALSRATSQSGVLIKSWRPSSIKVDRDSVEYYSSLMGEV